MPRTTRASLLSLPVVVVVGAVMFFTQACAGQSQSQPLPQADGSKNDSLKIIDNPGGGQIIYGPIPDQSTMQGAMGEMLRNVHGHFGERPQIGTFVQANSGDSVATFFSTNAKKEGGGTAPIYGMVIVSMTKGSKPIGAVLYDDAAHFATSQPAMMKTLNDAWSSAATAHGPANAGSPAQPSAPITLRQTTGGDRSASIGLPPGWQITGVAGGSLSALGPNGEMMDISSMFKQIQNPRAGQGDLFSAYASLVNQVRQSRGKPAATFHLVSSQKVDAQGVQSVFEVDLHDGKGMRKGNVRLDPVYTPGLPTWGLGYTSTNAPESVYATQSQVMNAMYKTYSQNRAIINSEQQTVLNGIIAAGERSKIEADTANQRREANSAAFEQHMDDISANSKSFQNYMLDRSTVAYTGANGQQAHGTFAYATADALVAQDPTRFRIIQTQEFMKGIDY
jgi:hypothetical protein